MTTENNDSTAAEGTAQTEAAEASLESASDAAAETATETSESTGPAPVTVKFADLKLDPKVLKAVAAAGYETPTPIQAGAIPPALEGRDVLGIAQTGTGKTASFTLPMITRLSRGRARARMPRSLVLCPTRELAAQVAENFDIYAANTRLTKALLIGGVSFGEQDRLIDRGVDVLIATPGRLLDHFERGKLLLTGVEVMVVDEADRMLDMGFIPDIERIFQLTPFTRQTLFFSATMAPEIERITNTFLHAPERIEIARQATTSETITQHLVELEPTRRDQTAKQKRELLRALIDAEGDKLTNAIIFCNRKTDVDIVAKSLAKHGYDAAPIHGDLDQSQRMRTLDGFRDGGLRVLVASDVAARGLDIPAVSHVFNYDLPSHAEDYVHRIGRTGRAGREGTAISLAVPADEKYLTAIENLIKKALPRAPLPEGFSLSSAAQDAPRKSSRGGRSGGGRGRGEGRRGRGRDSDADQATEQPQDQPEVLAQPETAPSGDTDGNNGGRARGGRGRRDRGGDRGRAPVMGMGDHVPEFMTRSFNLSDLAPAAPVEAESDAGDTSDDAEAPKPRKTRAKSTRSRKTADKVADDAASPAEADSAEAPDQAPAEAAADAASEDAPAKPKPARRSRKTTKAKAAEDAAPTEAEVPAAEPSEEEAPKPRRRRAPRRKAAEPAEPSDASADAPAPAAEAAPAPETAPASEPAPAADAESGPATETD